MTAAHSSSLHNFPFRRGSGVEPFIRRPGRWRKIATVLLGVMGVLAAGDFTYTDNAGGASVTITGYAPVPTGAYVLDIPAEIGGKAVTAIGNNAFYNFTGLTSVTIPASVTSIGTYAFFNCQGLTSVTLTNGLISIGANVFYSCRGLTNVTIPSTVTSLGVGAFYNCTGLTSMTIPSSITSIPAGLFYSCSGLTSVTIPARVTSIGQTAFQYCSSLTSVTIPASVTTIGNKAFAYCRGLTGIAIPGTVTGIGTEVFIYCSGLTAISVSAGNPNYSSLDGVLFNKLQTTLIAFPPGRSGGYSVPAGVTGIGNKAFFTCDKLVGVTLPSSLTSVGQQAFSTCSALLYANFTGNAPSVNFGAFELTAPGFSVYYLDGALDFTTPIWSVYNYPAVPMGTSGTASADWLLSKGLPANSNLQSDTNGDGVNLLMAYALNLEPHQNLSGSMPQPAFAADQMSLSFYAGNADVTYAVEASADMQTWTTAGVSLSEPVNQVRTATVAMTGPGRFMRLVVSK